MPAAKQIGASSTGASRGDINSQVDLQVLHEVYLAAHEALVKADVPIVICSSTMVNGEPVCESDEILYETLRGDWNFTGIVMSDKGGDERFTTSTAASQIMAGLDWDYGPSSSYRYALKEAIYERKTVSESYLNRTVHRILSIYDKVGLLDGKGSQGRYAGPLLDTKDLPQDVVEQHGYSAFEIAVRSAVLLKNFNKTLPVSKDANIAVIGPSGLQLTSGAGYGERAFGIRSRKISPWDALQTASPNREVKRAVGVDTHGIVVPAWALRTFDGRPGIRRDDTEGNTVVDPVLNFAGDTALPAGIGFDWTGQILAPEAGFYRIAVQRYYPSTGSRIGNDPAYERIADSGLGTIQWTIDDVGFLKSMRLRGDGGLRPWGAAIPTLDNWDEVGIDLNLTAGWHNLSIGVPPLFKGDKTQVRLAWTPPVGRRARIEEAVKLAAEVDVPIVFAHAESPAQVGMQLLQGHDELIAAVAKANKNTVVVLHNAEPVLMPWLDDVAAVLWMGHPGQEGGRAVADLLMGASSPQGRLPVTYPASVATSLTRSPAQPERVNTTTGTAVFSEGINSGYRWYLASQTKTLFPFGYGLSYTEFEYKNLQLTVKRNEGEEVGIEVSVDVSNVGTVLGNVVPQLYIGPPKEADRDYKGIQFPVTKLVGFNNVEIRPGQMIPSKHYVSARQLSFWNPATRTWEVAKGTRQIWVGANAESRILVGEVTL